MKLTEIGIILLMFGVGLHFSIKNLLAVCKVAPRRSDRDGHRHRVSVGMMGYALRSLGMSERARLVVQGARV